MTLTDRQREVARALAMNKPIKRVADDLGISHKTVEYHWAKIKQAMGIDTTVALVHTAIAIGLVQVGELAT